MPGSLRTPGLITAFFALGFISGSRAQAPVAPAPMPMPASSPEAPQSTAAGKTDPTDARPKRTHLSSDALTAILTHSLPKYDPLAKTVELKPGGETSDGETGLSKNGIVRLQRFIVKERKPPVFTERQLYTKKGLAELELKRQPGLKVGNLLGMNEGIALQMYEEQERLDNLADLADEARSARDAGDSAGADALARERMRVKYRPSEIGGASHAPGQ